MGFPTAPCSLFTHPSEAPKNCKSVCFIYSNCRHFRTNVLTFPFLPLAFSWIPFLAVMSVPLRGCFLSGFLQPLTGTDCLSGSKEHHLLSSVCIFWNDWFGPFNWIPLTSVSEAERYLPEEEESMTFTSCREGMKGEDTPQRLRR